MGDGGGRGSINPDDGNSDSSPSPTESKGYFSISKVLQDDV